MLTVGHMMHVHVNRRSHDACLQTVGVLAYIIVVIIVVVIVVVVVVSVFDLGVRVHTGQKIDDVILPPWAKSPEDFIQKHKEALVRTRL